MDCSFWGIISLARLSPNLLGKSDRIPRFEWRIRFRFGFRDPPTSSSPLPLDSGIHFGATECPPLLWRVSRPLLPAPWCRSHRQPPPRIRDHCTLRLRSSCCKLCVDWRTETSLYVSFLLFVCWFVCVFFFAALAWSFEPAKLVTTDRSSCCKLQAGTNRYRFGIGLSFSGRSMVLWFIAIALGVTNPATRHTTTQQQQQQQ